jgi:ribosomal protein L11 methyltransferase
MTTVARLICDEPTARQLAAVLGESLDGTDTVCAAFEGAGGQWQMAIHFRDAPDQDAIRSLVAGIAGTAAAPALTFEPVEAADWVVQSLAGLKPVRAGRFVVHGAHDRNKIPINCITIEIEAALAFGTGHHGTTCGCLLALGLLAKKRWRRRKAFLRHPEVRAKRASKGGGRSSFGARLRRAPQDDGSRVARPRVLDIGTGSGVLAIAAAKVFRTRVTASDIDRHAAQAARVNAQANRTARYITAVHAPGITSAIARRAPYDLILANILLGPIVRLAVPIERLSAPGATIVLSGLLPAHVNAVLAIYRAQGLMLDRRIMLDGWVTLVMRKPNRPGRG